MSERCDSITTCDVIHAPGPLASWDKFGARNIGQRKVPGSGGQRTSSHLAGGAGRPRADEEVAIHEDLLALPIYRDHMADGGGGFNKPKNRSNVRKRPADMPAEELEGMPCLSSL